MGMPNSESTDAGYFDQHSFRCRLQWGHDGTRMAAQNGDIVVIVDTLSFSTATVTAVAHGALIHPCGHDDNPATLAGSLGAECAVARHRVPADGRFSLSPGTFTAAEPGTRVVLASPNGAACSRHGAAAAALFVGALVNARALAGHVRNLLATSGKAVTVIACGERWSQPGADGQLRFAAEDYLAAGAIIAALGAGCSPEAEICANTFLASERNIARLIAECGSGIELRKRGYAHDVEHAAQLNCYSAVPQLRQGWLAPAV